jgi:hypothetical protein
MFEPGFDQAAGLRGEAPVGGPVLVPVSSPAQPARAYEWLCTLATALTAEGRAVVIVDGTASEASRHDGAQLGLMRVLQDPSIAHLEHPMEGADWLVIPGAAGLQALQETAQAAGSEVALSRLLTPFASGAVVLLFAPAFSLAALLYGLGARALVPVIEQPQSSIDAYGAVKLLDAAGLAPVLAPLASGAPASLQTVVHTVIDTAQRHLGLSLDSWPVATWALRAQESAIERPRPTHAHGYHGLVPGASRTGRSTAAAPSLWS